MDDAAQRAAGKHSFSNVRMVEILCFVLKMRSWGFGIRRKARCQDWGWLLRGGAIADDEHATLPSGCVWRLENSPLRRTLTGTSPSGEEGNRSGGRAWLAIVGLAVALISSMGQAHSGSPHPLDPLTPDELTRLRGILAASERFSSNVSFAWIELREPPKTVVSSRGPVPPRIASIAAIDYGEHKSFSVLVDLGSGRISELSEITSGQPALISRDNEIAQATINADPRVKEALTKRGLKVPGRLSDTVGFLYQNAGNDRAIATAGRRLVRVLFLADQNAINQFGPTVDGVMAVVDVFSGEVVAFTDLPGVPMEPIPHDIFDLNVRGGAARIKPVVPTQPEGTNFSVEEQAVSWLNWRFRFGFNLREGLVLYQIGFADAGRIRPVAYRASIAEVATPYGDPDERWAWMSYLDEGGFGLGYSSAHVRRGREVPANAVTISPVMPEPTKPQFRDAYNDRIYLYERDGGNLLLYQQEGRRLQTRSTELVIGFLAWLGNYTYAFNWVFHPDGTFALEVELEGEIFTKLVRARVCGACADFLAGPTPDGTSLTFQGQSDEEYGTLVHPGLVGINHQHWFAARVDFDVDGWNNAVMENDIVTGESHGLKAGSSTGAIRVTHKVLAKAIDARRDVDGHGGRSWTIYNPSSLNRAGRPAGYTIVPMSHVSALFPAGDASGPYGFAFHQLWVTPQREGELYAAGHHPMQAGTGDMDTLFHYSDQSSIYDRDIVVWCVFGATHVPRPEDYPIISGMTLSVQFRPDGFFDGNPALVYGSDD